MEQGSKTRTGLSLPPVEPGLILYLTSFGVKPFLSLDWGSDAFDSLRY